MIAKVARHPVAIVVTVLASSILLGGLTFSVASALSFYQPVNSGPYRFDATVLNNTSGNIVLRGCEQQGCAVFHEPVRLLPDAKVTVATSSDDSPHWWLVSNEAGDTLGCLNLQFTRKIQGLVVQTSDLQMCTSDTPRSIPPLLNY